MEGVINCEIKRERRWKEERSKIVQRKREREGSREREREGGGGRDWGEREGEKEREREKLESLHEVILTLFSSRSMTN